MGHFDLLGRAYLAETDGALRFGAVERAKPKPNPLLDQLPKADQVFVEPCLELQADHDAMEMAINGYAREDWPLIRTRAAAISAIVMLIELVDATHGQPNISHPKAATRIFQLLGHIWDIPKIPAMVQAQRESRQIAPADLPSDEKHAAFVTETAMPVILDAITLARIAGAASIAADIDTVTAFAQDVMIVSTGGNTTALTTAGAQQYADLLNLNARLMALQGLEGLG
ncbi:hypothetical protein E2K80_18830 [Rhodophyticola sp. CCM32]|uniref:hypothetical protein n=1 Tax=Rhodophyticola sp. CCM32 TaxID=2916397 RepID=UPI00107F5E78|nr:hypothetical protein [Rhodophyticola sp. CCM32]QBY02538.1 hypothetical protein E2K80_18830 [Rhodophyticola sp. CCM32]